MVIFNRDKLGFSKLFVGEELMAIVPYHVYRENDGDDDDDDDGADVAPAA